MAKEKKLSIADLNQMFQDRIKQENKPNEKVLTNDGVHMAFEGNKLMATGVLKALGLDDAQLKKAQESWASIQPAPPKAPAKPASTPAASTAPAAPAAAK